MFTSRVSSNHSVSMLQRSNRVGHIKRTIRVNQAARSAYISRVAENGVDNSGDHWHNSNDKGTLSDDNHMNNTGSLFLTGLDVELSNAVNSSNSPNQRLEATENKETMFPSNFNNSNASIESSSLVTNALFHNDDEIMSQITYDHNHTGNSAVLAPSENNNDDYPASRQQSLHGGPSHGMSTEDDQSAFDDDIIASPRTPHASQQRYGGPHPIGPRHPPSSLFEMSSMSSLHSKSATTPFTG